MKEIKSSRTLGRKLTCLVCEQVRDPPQLLRDCAGANHSPQDFWVPSNYPAVHDLAHVQVHTQTGQKNRANVNRIHARPLCLFCKQQGLELLIICVTTSGVTPYRGHCRGLKPQIQQESTPPSNYMRLFYHGPTSLNYQKGCCFSLTFFFNNWSSELIYFWCSSQFFLIVVKYLQHLSHFKWTVLWHWAFTLLCIHQHHLCPQFFHLPKLKFHTR